MIKLIHVNVECHSGFKADEYPKYFYWDNNRFEIYEIKDRWYQSTNNPEYPVSNYFKVETNFGQEFIIKHELECNEWYLVR
jgi:hypothetical protein